MTFSGVFLLARAATVPSRRFSGLREVRVVQPQAFLMVPTAALVASDPRLLDLLGVRRCLLPADFAVNIVLFNVHVLHPIRDVLLDDRQGRLGHDRCRRDLRCDMRLLPPPEVLRRLQLVLVCRRGNQRRRLHA